MEKKQFKKELPIIIGLSGKAGSGKTSVAEHIVPKGSIDTKKYGAKWDHIFYALPLYEMANIRRNIKGVNEQSRQHYAIHSALYDVYGNSSIGIIPEYNDFVSRVNKIQSLPIEPEGIKPRTFLQKAGDVCRESYEDCFAMWGTSKSMQIYRKYVNSISDSEEEELPFIVFISDVRFVNEAERILNQPNGMVICFDAEQDTLNNRLFKRDGALMSDEQSSHKSEQQISDIMSISSAIIKTDNMTIEEQSKATLSILGILDKQNA